MGEHEADYVDTPASGVEFLCVTCGGDGWVVAYRAAVIGGRMGTMPKHELCPTCSPARPSGRVSLETGPGTHRLRQVDRVPFPNDGWG